jgi:membrane protein implicated in regulation of membrane protease activity
MPGGAPCLGIGALLTTPFSFLEIPFWGEWALFAVFSLASIYTIRPLAKRFFFKDKPATRSNVDGLIGRRAWVTEEVNPPHLGMVKIEGEVWRAEAAGRIEANSWAMVVGINGTRLEIKKAE